MENIENTRSRVSIKSGLIAGFIASVISAIVWILIWAFAIVPEFDFVMIQGSIFYLAGRAAAAWVVYFIIGTFFWGLLYAWSEPHFPGRSPVKKGLFFGIIIWLVVMIILMPFAGGGLFLSEYGLVSALIVLVVDLIFGATLGYSYNRLKSQA